MGGEWSDALLDSIALSTDYVANGSFAMLRENVAYRNTPSYAILIRTVDFNNNWSGDYVWVDRSAFEFLSKSRLEPGDLVMSNVGSVGTVFRVPNLGQPMTLGPNAVMCRTRDTTRLDQRFLYYFFLAPQGQNKLREITSGSVQPKFNKTDLRSLCIPLPQIGEQRAIAHILGTLDDKIELNRRMSETLEAMARALFKSWFVDFDPVRAKMEGRWRKGESLPGLPTDLWEVFPDRLVDSELGEIPEGWCIVDLPDEIDFLEGPGLRNWQYRDEGMKFLNIRCILDGDLDIAKASAIGEEEFEKTYSHFALHEDDIVISTSGTLGRLAVVRPEHLPVMLNTSIIRMRGRESMGQAFVWAFLQSAYFVEEMFALASGSVQLNFGPMHLRKIRMLCPPDNVLDCYENTAMRLIRKALHNRSESYTLSSLRDTLLPKLISGEITVDRMKDAIG